MATLEELRAKIDKVDEKLLEELNNRAKLAIQIRETKDEVDANIYSPGRERHIIERITKLAEESSPFPPEHIERIYRTIISASRSLVGAFNIVYLGPELSESHDAALKQFGAGVSQQPAPSTDKVFFEVENGAAEFGIVPLETSSSALVTSTLQAFQDSSLQVVAEVELRRRLCLISKRSTLKDVQQIYSDINSFSDALAWINTNLPAAKLSIKKNSQAAITSARKNHTSACVVSEVIAAETEEFTQLANGIEEQSSKTARFVVVGNQLPKRTGRDKTSLLFAVKERTSTLLEILQPFAEGETALSKIGSRPVGSDGTESLFFIEIYGHQSESSVAAALKSAKAHCSYFKVLGSYPASS